MHNQAPIQRRKSTRIYVGNVPIGDGAPIAVQSMTNTRTTDVEATVNQIKALERVGADIVRVSVPTMDAAEAFKLIKQQVNVPLVADIHFDYRIALKVAEYGVDCLRINPGNIGNEERIRMVVDCARDKNIPIRIGVNAGSLEKDLQEKYGEPTPQALLESAMRHVDHLDRLNFEQFKVSVKASDVFLAVESYRLQTENFAAQLMELTITPFLRTLVTEHRPDIPQTLFLIVQKTMLDAGAYTARRPFRAQSQAVAIAILKGVHLFFNHVGDFTNRTFE